MKFCLLRLGMLVPMILTIVGTNFLAGPQRPPNPVLYLTHTEPFVVGGKQSIRYYYDVFNKHEFPEELFASAPSLPPCGINTNASRTWIDVYDQNGKRLNSFCAITSLKGLEALWFALDKDIIPPSWIYIEFTDRQINTKYRSNLAETVQ